MLPLILIILLILLLTYVYNKLKTNYKYWQNLNVPCERPHWIFGSMHGVVTERTFFDVWQNYYKQFKGSGPFAGFFWFFKPAVFVMDLALIKQILIKDFDKFPDRGLFVNEDDDPLGAHLFSMQGPKWKRLRSKLSPAFSSGKMKLVFPIMVEVAQEMLSVVDNDLQSHQEIDVTPLVGRYVIDVIGRSAFGIECNCLKDPKQEFYTMSRRVLLENHLGPIGVAFRSSFPDLARRLHMRDTVPEIADFFTGTVRETVKYREQNNIERNDFMDTLLELKNNKVVKNEMGNYENLTFNEIAAQAFVFLGAGSETSSTTMAFVLYELALNESVQNRAREEIVNVLSAHDQELNYESLLDMQYLKQVLEETMRLHTPLPVLNRYANEDYTVAGHPKYKIRKGMPIIIPSICLHRDEQYYPNPNIFNPDNFSKEKVAERDPVLYMPFGDGPRNCIGLRFARLQVLIGLSMLLKNYKFSLGEKTPVPMTYNKEHFVLTPEKEVYLKVCKISK